MVKNLNIIKRDGSIVEFNRCKIEDAILKAMKYGSGIYEEEIAKKIAKEIEINCFENENSPTVYQVENMVYNKLIQYKHELTAKAYEGYRAVQSFKREVNTTDDSIIGLLDKSNEDEYKFENLNTTLVDGYITKDHGIASLVTVADCNPIIIYDVKII